MTKRVTVKDTDKSKNILVEVEEDLTLDEMEKILTNAGNNLALVITHITTLSRKKYPGNRHWHFKEATKSKGCLDVTYWPEGALFWITIRNYEPDWVHKTGHDLAVLLKEKMAARDS